MAIKDRKDEIINALCEKNIFDDSGNIPPWSSKIWKEVSDDLNRIEGNGQSITANYLYVILYNNRYDILQQLKKKCGIVEEISTLVDMSSQSEDEEMIYSLETVEPCQKKSKSVKEKLPTKRFKVVIPNESYKEVQPINRVYKTKNEKRELLHLQVDWSDLFLDAFWEQHKIPCTYIVRKHYISIAHSVNLLSFNGQCKYSMCKATFIGEIDNEPQVGEDVVIVFIAQDTFGVDRADEKKRPLCHQKRKIVDVQGLLLYNKNVLRKAKQEVIDDDLGISRSNLLISLTNLKHEAEHNGSIHTTCFDNFFLHYWSPIQNHLYQTTMKSSWMVLSVDATGSLIIPLTRTENNISSGHILLYQMVMSSGDQTISVAQQLSEKQDMLSIYYWMANWVASSIKPPNGCVSDYSRALLGAINRSFCNRLIVKKYLETCFSFLLNKSITLPQCFIRVDVAHIMHILSRWKSLKGRRLIKDFYLRCIALLYQTKIQNEFEETLKNIFTIAMAEFDGDNMNGQPAEKARQYLQNLISGTDLSVQVDENEEQTNFKGIATDNQFHCEPEVNSEPIENMCFIDWINDILQVTSREASVQRNRLNAYYCLDLINPLLRLCSEFSLWSAVMVEAFNSPNKIASSARVEGYFKDLKNSITKKKTSRMRSDKFVVSHLRAIKGAIKLAKSNMDIKNQNLRYFNANDKGNIETLDNSTNKVEKYTNCKTTTEPLDSINSCTEYEVTEKSTSNSCEYEKKIICDEESVDALMNYNYSDDMCMKLECYEKSSQNKLVDENTEDDTNSNISESICSRESTPIPEIPEELENENWRNKIENPKKRRSLYMDKHPEIKAKSQASPQYKKEIDILKNGNCLGPVTIKENKKSKEYILLNTCPFDAIVQGIAIAYIDSNSYAEYLSCSKNEVVQLAMSLVKKGALKEIYQKRAKILAPICKKKILIGNVIELDAQYNVNYLIETLLNSEPSIQQYHTCENFKCHQNVIPKQFYPLNLGEIMKGSFSNLQKAIDNMIPSPLQQSERRCLHDGCSGMITVTKSLMQHIWFDTILNIMEKNIKVKCRLFDIPYEVIIQNTSFRLVAVIDFIENKEGNMSHYVIHVNRTSGRWETYDDLSEVVLKCKSNKIVTSHVLYYIRSI